MSGRDQVTLACTMLFEVVILIAGCLEFCVMNVETHTSDLNAI